MISFNARSRSSLSLSSSLTVNRRRKKNGRRTLKATRASSSNTKDLDDDDDDDDDDETAIRQFSLTENQARIAALAFDVLYEKPFLDEEKMMKDPERPKLRLMLREAIDKAKQLCKEVEENTTTTTTTTSNKSESKTKIISQECRAAWEVVDELEDAALRAGMSRSTKSTDSMSKEASSTTVQRKTPRRIPKLSEVGKTHEELQAAKRNNTNERIDPFSDPLKDIDPCGPLGCAAQTGEMNSRGILERAMKIPNKDERKKFDKESDVSLANAITMAVSKAMSLCAEGGDTCAAAWDEVEELSASASKRRREKREMF